MINTRSIAVIFILALLFSGCGDPDAVDIPDRLDTSFSRREGYFEYQVTFKDGIFSRANVRGLLEIELFNWDLSDGVSYTDGASYDNGKLLASVTYYVDREEETEGRILFDPDDVDRTYISPRYTFYPENTGIMLTGTNMYSLSSRVDMRAAQHAFESGYSADEMARFSKELSSQVDTTEFESEAVPDHTDPFPLSLHWLLSILGVAILFYFFILLKTKKAHEE